MIKRIVCIMGVLAWTVVFTAAAHASEIEYSILHRDIIVSGNADKARDIINMELVKEDVNPDSLTPDIINTSTDMAFKSIQSGADGVFYGKMALGANFSCGKYVLYLNYAPNYEEKEIIVADLTAIQTHIPGINSASDKELPLLILSAASAGWSGSVASEHIETVAEWIGAHRPMAGYTAEGFVHEYMRAEAIARLKSAEISTERLIESYAPYLELSYEEFAALSPQIRSEADNLLKSYDFGNDKLEALIEEAVLCARVKNAGSVEALKEIILEYYRDNSIDMSTYNTIRTDYYKNEVFRSLYADKDTISTFSRLNNVFDSAAKKQKSEENKNSTSNPGSATGGGGSYYPGGVNSGSIISNEGNVDNDDDDKEIFNDIQNHWAYSDIMAMYQKGVISGYGDSNFRPNAAVTRAEFAKMVVEIKKLSEGYSDMFKDVDREEWFAPFVGAAANAGLVVGYDGYFMPNKNISREEAAVIIYRMIFDKAVAGAKADFEDFDEISEFAVEAVDSLFAMGVIVGDNGNFYPRNDITRAETVVILSRVEKLLR